jgi:hypothetical protein
MFSWEQDFIKQQFLWNDTPWSFKEGKPDFSVSFVHLALFLHSNCGNWNWCEE